MPNSIITPPTNTPNPQQFREQQAKLLATKQLSLFSQIQQVYQQTVNFIWSDPTQAQAAFDAFTAAGYKASDLLINSAATITLIGTLTGVVPVSPIPSGYSLTVNADGSVTVISPILELPV